MELKRYAALGWKWLWLIVLSSALAGLASFAVSYATTPVYEASTTILINQAPASRPGGTDYNSVLASERLARTYAELLRKRPVLEEVVAALSLNTTPDALAKRMRVAVLRDTQLIALSVEDTSPEQAAAIANEVVEVFSRQNRELQASRYGDSRQGLQAELNKLQADIDQTAMQLDEIGQQRPANGLQSAEERQLQVLLAQYRDSYTSLLKSYEDVRLAESQASDSVSIAEAAQPPIEPVRPQTLLTVLLATLVGMIIALGAVLLIEYLDDTVKASDDIQTLTAAPPLAVIAKMRVSRPREALVTITDRLTPVAEAYRILQANIGFAALDRPLRSLLITSGSPAEGKSITAANLAIAMAQAGRRVILVDADLRRPTLHRLFGIGNERGLTTALLNQDIAVDEYLARTEVKNLRLLTSGPLPPNPTELLSSQRLLDMVNNLKSCADIVIFDSPPILAVADAALLARLSDATLLVVHAGVTRASACTRSRNQLLQTGTKLLGTVLNRVPKASSDGYGYSYYYYAPTSTTQSTTRSSEYKNGHRKGSTAELITIVGTPDSERS